MVDALLACDTSKGRPRPSFLAANRALALATDLLACAPQDLHQASPNDSFDGLASPATSPKPPAPRGMVPGAKPKASPVLAPRSNDTKPSTQAKLPTESKIAPEPAESKAGGSDRPTHGSDRLTHGSDRPTHGLNRPLADPAPSAKPAESPTVVYSLVPHSPERYPTIQVNKGAQEQMTVGRRDVGEDKRVSREHLLLQSHPHHLLVRCVGANRSEFRRPGGAVEPMAPNQDYQLHHGDELFVLPGGMLGYFVVAGASAEPRGASPSAPVATATATTSTATTSSSTASGAENAKKRGREDEEEAPDAAPPAKRPKPSLPAPGPVYPKEEPKQAHLESRALDEAFAGVSMDVDPPGAVAGSKTSPPPFASTAPSAPSAAPSAMPVPGMTPAEESEAAQVKEILQVLPDVSTDVAVRALRQAQYGIDLALDLILNGQLFDPPGPVQAPQQPVAPLPDSASAPVPTGVVSAPPPRPARASSDLKAMEKMLAKLRANPNRSNSEDQLLQEFSSRATSLAKAAEAAENEKKAQEVIIGLLTEDKAAVEAKLSEVTKVQRATEQAARLYLDGESQALECNLLRVFRLYPRRTFENDAATQHFRTAESQLHRLLEGHQGMEVSMVEYIVNPHLIRRFEQKRLELATRMEWNETKPILCWHGTGEANIDKIIVTNFDLTKVGSSTDAGFYGAGIYFSEFPGLSMGYVQGCTKFLLCQVLTGRTYHCPTMMNGAPLVAGYDSHMSPDKHEIVIFNADQILPYYIVHYKNKAAAAVFGGGGFGGYGGWGGKKIKAPAPKGHASLQNNPNDDFYDLDVELPSAD